MSRPAAPIAAARSRRDVPRHPAPPWRSRPGRRLPLTCRGRARDRGGARRGCREPRPRAGRERHWPRRRAGAGRHRTGPGTMRSPSTSFARAASAARNRSACTASTGSSAARDAASSARMIPARPCATPGRSGGSASIRRCASARASASEDRAVAGRFCERDEAEYRTGPSVDHIVTGRIPSACPGAIVAPRSTSSGSSSTLPTWTTAMPMPVQPPKSPPLGARHVEAPVHRLASRADRRTARHGVAGDPGELGEEQRDAARPVVEVGPEVRRDAGCSGPVRGADRSTCTAPGARSRSRTGGARSTRQCRGRQPVAATAGPAVARSPEGPRRRPRHRLRVRGGGGPDRGRRR